MFGRMVSGGACAFEKRDDGSYYIDRDSSCYQHILDYLTIGNISDEVVEKNGPEILEEAIFYMLSGLKDQIYKYSHVKVTVGGKDFIVSRKVLKRYPNSMFGRMLLGKDGAFEKVSDDSFYIERDCAMFHHILNYLRVGRISDDVIEECGLMICKEAEFYGLAGLKEQIHNYNVLRLNVGGRQFIANREVMKRHPESMFGRMVSGRRCAFEKSNDGSYYIDRDSSCFQHILDFLDGGTLSDNIIERDGVHLMKDAEFYMLNGLKELICRFDIVKINVGGKEFSTTHRAIKRYLESKLFQMLLGNEFHKMADGSFFIDHDGSYFHEILQVIRIGKTTYRPGYPDPGYFSMSSYNGIRKNELDNEYLFYFGCRF